MALKGKKKEVKCAICETVIFRSKYDIEKTLSGKFFCSRDCRSKGQTKEMGLIGHARKGSEAKLSKRKRKVKLRRCLGWCGKMIESTPEQRFCDSCTNRKAFASTGVDEFEHLGVSNTSDHYVTNENMDFFL